MSNHSFCLLEPALPSCHGQHCLTIRVTCRQKAFLCSFADVTAVAFCCDAIGAPCACSLLYLFGRVELPFVNTTAHISYPLAATFPRLCQRCAASSWMLFSMASCNAVCDAGTFRILIRRCQVVCASLFLIAIFRPLRHQSLDIILEALFAHCSDDSFLHIAAMPNHAKILSPSRML